jgi:GNAT superfamily N-acetyltransferase
MIGQNMNDRLSFRPAMLVEHRALEELQWRASLMWEEYREALLENPDAIELPAEHIGSTIVAERLGETVGFAVVLPRPDGNAELDGLFVEPSAWRGGIGRRLVAEAQKLASARGAKAIHVIANPRAKGFYVACGFILLGKTSTRFGPGLRMRRAITEE